SSWACTMPNTIVVRIISSLVSIGAVGIHVQPWPELSRLVWPQSVQDPEPPARGSPRDLATWHRRRRDRWSGVVRIRPRDGGGLRPSRADTRTLVPPWPHASTVIQWRQPSARAWLRLDWFASADADCNECLKNMTSGKCQKTSDTSSRSHDHTPKRPSKRWPAS